MYAYAPYVAKAQYSGCASIEDSLESLLGKVDFLTLHVPLTGDTEHLINSRTLKLVKPGCRIINTSRGGVIDESALARALRDGRLGGAALDVFEEEPLQPDHPLFEAPNTLFTPHIASSTPECLDRVSRQAAQGVLDVLQGRRPDHIVNPEVLGEDSVLLQGSVVNCLQQPRKAPSHLDFRTLLSRQTCAKQGTFLVEATRGNCTLDLQQSWLGVLRPQQHLPEEAPQAEQRNLPRKSEYAPARQCATMSELGFVRFC